MGYYAIGIGGTGAKCLESIIHLAAAGMMPDNRDLQVLFVDPDRSNGSLERTTMTLARYKECKSTIKFGTTEFLKTAINSAEAPNHVWTPFGDINAPRLDEFFTYNIFRNSEPTAAHLFEVLYSASERAEDLNEGFRGHPSIGSAVMAKAMEMDLNQEPWETFYNTLRKDNDARIFLAGSIFGGTGASGFPTIAQLIHNGLEEEDLRGHVKLGGTLVLPYFSFQSSNRSEGAGNRLHARSEEFLMNTQAALKYYARREQAEVYDAVYLCGNDERHTWVDSCFGGGNQKNAPHFIELYAALGAIHFFGHNFEEADQATPYFVTARNRNNSLQWQDLPDGDNGKTIRLKIGQLSRFAFAYLSVYKPTIDELKHNNKGYHVPWFVDFFKRNAIQPADYETQLNSIESYCKEFLEWLANIQINCSEEEEINLVKYEAYAEKDKETSLNLRSADSFRLEDFGNLIRSQEDADPNTLSKLWERMSNSRGKSPANDAEEIGKFLSSLYHNCASRPDNN